MSQNYSYSYLPYHLQERYYRVQAIIKLTFILGLSPPVGLRDIAGSSGETINTLPLQDRQVSWLFTELGLSLVVSVMVVVVTTWSVLYHPMIAKGYEISSQGSHEPLDTEAERASITQKRTTGSKTHDSLNTHLTWSLYRQSGLSDMRDQFE